MEIEFEVEAKNCEDCVLEICASFGGTVVSTTTVRVLQRRFKTTLDVRSMYETEWGIHLWTPETPNLYDMEFRLLCRGEAVDTVKSYLA